MFSFTDRKKQIDVHPYIRRLCDLTTPNFASPGDESRSENRYNRAIPTLLCPWKNKKPLADDCLLAITKDISDRGVGLILSQPFRAEAAIIGFWLSRHEMNDPWFFRGTAMCNSAIGGGFWLLGVVLNEFMNADHRAQLRQLMPLAANLLPPAVSQ